MKERVYFFLGPSMNRGDFLAQCAALSNVDVRVLPPVQQGSLLRLLNDPPNVIGIIDGYFLQVPSVLHKEILLLMQRGVRVLGAASMGALRAAELDTLGMEGVGSVYRMYKDGVIDGDDEVAVLHAPEQLDFRPLSEPLVNIRYNLRLAQASGIVSSRIASIVIRSAKHLPYTLRGFESALDGARALTTDHASLDSLGEFFRDNGRDVKREDVTLLVNTIVARVNKQQPWPPTQPVTVNETKYFCRQKRDYVGHLLDGRHIPQAVVISIHKVLSNSFPKFYDQVVRSELLLEEARHRDLVCGERDSCVESFFRSRNVNSDSARRRWLRQHYLEFDDLERTLIERDLLLKIRQLYTSIHTGLGSDVEIDARIVADVVTRTGIDELTLCHPFFVKPGIPGEERVLREMKVTGRFRLACKDALRVLKANAELDAANTDVALSDSQIERWAAARWGVQESRLPSAIRSRGFVSYSDFIEASRFVLTHEISRLLFIGSLPLQLVQDRRLHDRQLRATNT